MFDRIFSNVSKYTQLEKKELSFFSSLLVSHSIAKKDFLLKCGSSCNTIDYIESGVVRAFYDGGNANDSTIMFGVSDWWITDMQAFVNRQPAQISIQALETTSILRLSYENLEKLYREAPKFERVFRILMQNAYVREQQRVLENISLSAETRYGNFLKKYSSISKLVTQKHIASYLGITPEFLSTLRKRELKKYSIS